MSPVNGRPRVVDRITRHRFHVMRAGGLLDNPGTTLSGTPLLPELSARIPFQPIRTQVEHGKAQEAEGSLNLSFVNFIASLSLQLAGIAKDGTQGTFIWQSEVFSLLVPMLMDVTNPLSPRANAFSIASLMSGPGAEAMFMGIPPLVPPQRSTDCYFDWSQGGTYPTVKTMEGGYCVDQTVSSPFYHRLKDVPLNINVYV